MHNLPIVTLLTGFLALLLLAVLRTPPSVRSFLKDLVTVGEDQWTWTTRTGQGFEEVELKKIEADEVVLQHRFGVCRLAIEQLTEDSRRLLSRTPQWREHLFSVPARNKIAPFVREPSHAALAA
jgi:hypothetical protein